MDRRQLALLSRYGFNTCTPQYKFNDSNTVDTIIIIIIIIILYNYESLSLLCDTIRLGGGTVEETPLSSRIFTYRLPPPLSSGKDV